jgi:hypothetical protein
METIYLEMDVIQAVKQRPAIPALEQELELEL